MNLPDYDLDNIDSDTLATVEAMFAAALRERHPEYKILPGTALYSLLVRPLAAGHAATFKVIADYVKGRSLRAVQSTYEQGETVPDEIIEGIASNFGTELLSGNRAVGAIEVHVSRDINMSFSASTISFTSPNSQLTFVPSKQVFVGATTSSASIDDEGAVATKLVRSDTMTGTEYVFTLDVVATTDGCVDTIPAGSTISVAGTVPNLLRASAASDFHDGADDETVSELLSRLLAGTAPAFPSNQPSFDKILSDNGVTYVDCRACGASSGVMLRDNILVSGVWEHTSGLIDLYVRTATVVPIKTVEIVFTSNIAAHDASSPLVIDFDGAAENFKRFVQIAGFYEVTGCTNTGFTVEDVSYGVLDTDDEDSGRITAPPGEVTPVYGGQFPESETAFSAYRTCSVSLSNPAITASDTEPYTVKLQFAVPASTMNIQKLFSNEALAPAAGDIMVKAPVPVFVTAAVNIEYTAGVDIGSDEFIANLDSNICKAVNSIALGARTLSAAIVLPAINMALGNKGYVVDYPSFMGRIVTPSGDVRILPRDISLSIPSDLAMNRNNTAFFMTPGTFNAAGKYSPVNSYNFVEAGL